jgi:hypothetical protein
MHFCEGKAELFPFGENVFMSGSSEFGVVLKMADELLLEFWKLWTVKKTALKSDYNVSVNK